MKMTSKPCVTIVLPTYNQAQYLPDTLNSIFDQTYRDFELVVVNDGSTDETANILRDYRRMFDFQLIEQENQGLPTALNIGFGHSSGRYLTWTSSDNLLLPKMLETLVLELENYPSVGVVYSDWAFIDSEGRAISDFRTVDYDKDLLLGYNFIHCSFLFRKLCMDQVGGYDPNFIYGEDWEFWIRVSRSFGMRHVPMILYSYRIHGQTMTDDLIHEKAPRRMNDKEFRSYRRRQSYLGWYFGKIKWRLVTRKLGYDPRDEWHHAITSQIGRT